MTPARIIAIVLGMAILTQGCSSAQVMTVDGGQQATEIRIAASPTSMVETPAPPPTATPDSTIKPSPTPEPVLSVRVIAVDGNLYIRRGPGTEYNRIGLLKNGESARVIGQDMLGKWVQVQIPKNEASGWVSLLTPFSRVEGDLSQVESFTFTEWPQPAYIKNCTEHDLIIGPNELYLYNLFTNSRYLNEVQVDPGVYDIYDLFLPGEPKIQTVDIREGETIYITVDGSGTEHLCP